MFSNYQLKMSIKENQMLPLPNIPNHTQFVERMVKIVSEASKKCIRFKKRELYIRNVLQSRKLIPSVGTKKDFLNK